jgi:hypothetical protein
MFLPYTSASFMWEILILHAHYLLQRRPALGKMNLDVTMLVAAQRLPSG